MLAVEIEVSPCARRLRGPLQQLTCCVAEVLRDVDSLDLPLRGGRPAGAAAAGLPIAEEVGEEVVEETAAAAAEAARHLLFGEIDLAEILDFLRSVGVEPHPRCDRRSSVSWANWLIGGGHWQSSLVGRQAVPRWPGTSNSPRRGRPLPTGIRAG